ncbi:hypothetical protein BY458DRAFT_546253 [Sporodiniella umbellata]|nr:hypothetical protein BY458DRAFT_546253 [Sporodiniella umbellata]
MPHGSKLTRLAIHSESSIFEQEIKEDVLPFLLQAQDIIAKLESRVVGLENDLATIYCKYENDQKEWSTSLDKRNKHIDSLSSKTTKLEFNSKEAILLLSELEIDNEQTQATINLCLQYLRQSEPKPSKETPEQRQKRFSEGNAGVKNNERAKSTIYCTHCKPLLTQLNSQIEQKSYLRRDLGSLATALSKKEAVCSVLEQDKRQLESEVQAATASLFSALNQFWMDEAMDRACLALLDQELQGKLTAVQRPAREPRLSEMKACLVRLDSALQKSTQTCVSTAVPLGPLRSPSIGKVEEEDPVLEEFQQHLETVQVNQSGVLPMTDFTKRILVEDIEPCLFFGTSLAWWKLHGFKKKLGECLVKDTCRVKSTTLQPNVRCICCHRSHTSLSALYLNSSLQGPIDRFCRDRILAVSAYYRFISRLRQLATENSWLELFQQAMWHRFKMSQSRRSSQQTWTEDVL